MLAVLLTQVVQRLHHFLGAKLVHIAERAAEERREADAEHRADVAVARAADHAFVQAARRFVQHHHHAALSDARR